MTDHDPKNCQSLLGRLSEYVDGTLDARLCEIIERHMAGCNNCTIVVNTLRKTIALYKGSATAGGDLPGVVRDRLYRTLNLEDFLHR